MKNKENKEFVVFYPVDDQEVNEIINTLLKDKGRPMNVESVIKELKRRLSTTFFYNFYTKEEIIEQVWQNGLNIFKCEGDSITEREVK